VTRFAFEKNQCQNNKQSVSSLSRFDLINVKARAVRRGVWFRVLSRMERACVDLVVMVVGRVRSSRLQEMLALILSKLEDAMRNPMQHLMRTEAKSLALKLSQIAQQWGNKLAVQWAEDFGFIEYLTVTCINTPFGLGVG
jgi:hypothetical protein